MAVMVISMRRSNNGFTWGININNFKITNEAVCYKYYFIGDVGNIASTGRGLG